MLGQGALPLPSLSLSLRGGPLALARVWLLCAACSPEGDSVVSALCGSGCFRSQKCRAHSGPVCSCSAFTVIVGCVCHIHEGATVRVSCRLSADDGSFPVFYCGGECCDYFWACLRCTSLLRVSPGAVLLGVLLSSLKSLQAALQSGGAGLKHF